MDEKVSLKALKEISSDALVAQPKPATEGHTVSSPTQSIVPDTQLFLFNDVEWQALLAQVAGEVEKDKLNRHHHRDKISQQVSHDGFAHFTQCTSTSFTKPSKNK